MTLNTMSNFKQRLTVGGIGIVLMLVGISLSFSPWCRPFFILFIASIVGSAVWEYYQLAKAKGYHPLEAAGIVFTVAYLFAVSISTQTPLAEQLPNITLGLAIMAFFLYYFIKGNDPVVNLAVTVFGLIYLAIPLGCIIRINYFFPIDSPHDGRIYLLYLFIVAKMTDTGAYFFGKKFGYYKLAPYISPKKTWEGAIGGLIVAIFSSLCFFFIARHFTSEHSFLTISQSVWFGALISIMAQFGDLAESLLKRDCGAKDSNHLPGLGGALDVVDSLVFTLPLMYIFLMLSY